MLVNNQDLKQCGLKDAKEHHVSAKKGGGIRC